jgi:hypothetical protein
MSDFTNFRAVYDDLTDEVSRAHNTFLPDHLRNWFRHLDDTPRVAAIVRRLEHGLDIDRFAEQAMEDQNETLDWGDHEEKALGMRLLLFRQFASGKQDISLWGFHFLHAGNNVNANAEAFVRQVFEPMVRELRRFLEKDVARLEREEDEEAQQVPASDRTVTINHNSKEYTEADEAMENLEKAIREANDFQDPFEKEQREAEVSAGRRLLKAARVRLEPLAALLRPVLAQFTTKVKDNLVSAAALAVSGALITLLGLGFKALLGL